jgi:hypothetical protein
VGFQGAVGGIRPLVAIAKAIKVNTIQKLRFSRKQALRLQIY